MVKRLDGETYAVATAFQYLFQTVVANAERTALMLSKNMSR